MSKVITSGLTLVVSAELFVLFASKDAQQFLLSNSLYIIVFLTVLTVLYILSLIHIKLKQVDEQVRLNLTKKISQQEYQDMIKKNTEIELKQLKKSKEFKEYLNKKAKFELQPIILDKEDEIIFSDEE